MCFIASTGATADVARPQNTVPEAAAAATPSRQQVTERTNDAFGLLTIMTVRDYADLPPVLRSFSTKKGLHKK